MSGSPKNIQRDATFIEPKTADDLSWPTETALGSATVTVNAKTAVHTDYAQAHSYALMGCSQDTLECIGVYMSPPDGDNWPYRVKADLCVVGQSGTLNNQAIVIGYGPASPTGSDDSIDEPYFITFDQDRFDDLIIVPPLDSGDGNYGRPLFFGIAHLAGQAIGSLRCFAHISVQNLGVKPPTMHNAVS